MKEKVGKIIIYILGGVFVAGSIYGAFVYLPGRFDKSEQLATVSETITQLDFVPENQFEQDEQVLYSEEKQLSLPSQETKSANLPVIDDSRERCQPSEEKSFRKCETDKMGICQEGIQSCENGFWAKCQSNPGEETCNSLDDNCDGLIDEDDVCLVIKEFPSSLTPEISEPVPLTQAEIDAINKVPPPSPQTDADIFYSVIDENLPQAPSACPGDGTPLQRDTFSNGIRFVVAPNCKHHKGDYRAYGSWGSGLSVGFENSYWIPLNWLLSKQYIPSSIKDVARMNEIHGCEYALYLYSNGFLNWVDDTKSRCETFLRMTREEQFEYNCKHFKETGNVYFGSVYRKAGESIFRTDMCEEVYEY